MEIEIALCAYLIVINIVAFCMFWIDKNRSQSSGWRITERRLLTYAFYGGSLGAVLAGQIFRHKTKKQPFRRHLITIATVHIIFALVLLVPALRNFVFQQVAAIVKTLA